MTGCALSGVGVGVGGVTLADKDVTDITPTSRLRVARRLDGDRCLDASPLGRSVTRPSSDRVLVFVLPPLGRAEPYSDASVRWPEPGRGQPSLSFRGS